MIIKAIVGGLCGSDIPHWLRGPSTDSRPGYPLHEVVGEVVESVTDRLRVGDRVVGWASNNDGLAEKVATRSSELLRLDPGSDPVEAVVIQPLACVIAAVDRLPDVSGRSVAIVGLGPIGALFAHVLNSRGAGPVVGVDPIDREDVRARFGLDATIAMTSDKWCAGLGDNRPAVIIEAVGHQPGTLADAIAAVQAEGIVYCFGIPATEAYTVDMTTVVRRNLTLIGGVTLRRNRALEAAASYLHDHPDLARHLVSHRFGFDEVQRVYEFVRIPSTERLKVVLEYS